MTATPIPRTLALTIYGDLEASVLDELPPGRTPIVTRRMPEERADEVWEFVRKQVEAGRQAYIVYPIIEGERDDQPELDFANDESETSRSGCPNLGSETRVRASRANAREESSNGSQALRIGDRRRNAHREPHETPLRVGDVRRALRAVRCTV